MEEKISTHDFEDTVEMVQWRRISQEGCNKLWTNLSEKMEAEVLEK